MDRGVYVGRKMTSLTLFKLVLLLNCLLACSADCGEGVSRIRLSSGSNGIIVNPISGTEYKPNAKCSWYLEGNSNTSVIYLQITSYGIECLWDRLFVYQGQSVHGSLLGSLTGSNDLTQSQPLPLTSVEGSGSGTSSGGGADDVPPPPDSLIVTVPGSDALVYFYSDAGNEQSGFNISYWINSCIENCSGNGVCDRSTLTCRCDPSWSGLYCQIRTCPNGCSKNGQCDSGRGQCVCNHGYTGHDCSIIEGSSHWSLLSNSDIVARAGHSALLWNGWLLVYGGYRYNNGDIDNESSGSGHDGMSADFIRYHIGGKYWEEVPVRSSSLPQARYAHSAVLYNDYMVIYGGVLIGNEEITDELWQFELNTLTWSQLNKNRNESFNTTRGNEDLLFNSVDTTPPTSTFLPIPVKDHSANVVKDVMYVIFGISSIGRPLKDYMHIQQYNFTSDSWSVLPQDSGNTPRGRMGHTSVYSPSLDAILIHGGGYAGKDEPTIIGELLFYSLATNKWGPPLAQSDRPTMYHSSVLINDGVLLSFGGYTKALCFSQELQVYDILCNKWSSVPLPGLPPRAERLGHSGVGYQGSMIIFGGYNGLMLGDVLTLGLQNCTIITDEEECVNETFCMWNVNQCTALSLGTSLDHLSLDCDFDSCSIHHMCSSCTSNGGCYWSNTNNSCISNSTSLNTTTTLLSTVITSPDLCPQSPSSSCSQFSSCFSCQIHDGCVWNYTECISSSDSAPLMSCDIPTSCLQISSCSQCAAQKDCLWCASTHKCVIVPLYPVSFLYGQCLGWSSNNARCPEESCSGYNTCDSCHGDTGCGWCRDPSDTGLGSCSEGGYLSPLRQSLCPDTHWFYEQCPLCNCNGHSTCVNQTICEDCQDLTTGPNCERCKTGFYGNPVNGNNCTACDCNGYNPVCNHVNGSCTCLDMGVAGDRCTRCDGLALYEGDAYNFCYYEMSVGFIYTFSVADDSQRQTFYTAVPKSGSKLNVKFDITRNPLKAEIVVQFFIGRVSENYALLVNITNPIKITGGSSISKTFESFSSSGNSSDLFSFLRQSSRDATNFTTLLDSSLPNDYSKKMWNGDIGLVIYVYNQTTSLQYKITIDQNSLIFLAYFFVTFVVCFALLLAIFLLGWFIKRKLEVRAMIRAQRIELQRRVRRPFARLKAVVEKKPDLKAKQSASYVSVETCKNGKAAVLTLMIRLPCDRDNGHPSLNRTGVGFGSTLVRMNQSTKPKKEKKRNRRSDLSEDEHAT